MLYFRGDRRAVDFLRQTNAVIYSSRVTRKELLHPPIRARERQEARACLRRHRLVNPESQLTEGFSSLLEKYPYLRDHLADALIAATAWTKGLEDDSPTEGAIPAGNPAPHSPITSGLASWAAGCSRWSLASAAEMAASTHPSAFLPPRPIPKELQNLSQLAWISMPLAFLVFDITKHPIVIALIPSHSRHDTSLQVCTA